VELVPTIGGINTVADLLRRLVAVEIELTSQILSERRSILPLGLEELEEQLLAGRAGVADLPLRNRTDTTRAINLVTNAFTDGLILLFVDERRCLKLDDALDVNSQTRVMLIRRSMLTG
jgi:hypothetical protein